MLARRIGPLEIAERVGIYSLGVNATLATLKFSLAGLSGSLALQADAVHSLVDVFASLIVIAGLLIARRKSKSFPYGLYKVENMVAVILSLLIFVAAYEIAREALTGSERELANVPLALAGMAVATAVAFIFSLYERRAGRATGSPSLLADSQHFRTDVLSSSVVFIAILGSSLGVPLDRFGAAAIVLFIVWAGWGVLSDGMRVLLDASLDYGTLEMVRRRISGHRGVAEIRALRGRSAGRYKFIEVELTLRTDDLQKAHQISSEIEQAIKESIPNVDYVLIHYEPKRKTVLKWAIPLENLAGQVSPHFGGAQYFAIVRVDQAGGQVLDQEILANPYAALEKQKGIRAAEFLVDQGVDGVISRDSQEGKGPFYVLDDAGAVVRTTSRDHLQDVLADLGVRETPIQD